jgi:pantetheine-phosphate adenylyltransferase
MKKICLFPGTFDPVTLGHVDIINRALPLFDKIFVGIGINAAKNPMFSAAQRMDWFKAIYKNDPRVESICYEGLTIETIFLTGEPKYTSVASTIVRDILKNGGNAAPFLPNEVIATLQQHLL